MQCIVFDINLEGRRTSQYKNFTFNSMTRFGDSYLLANKHGLFIYEGHKDGTSLILSEFQIATTDFGIPNLKGIHSVYLGLETSEDLVLTVSADEKAPRDYILRASKNGQQRIRVRLGRKQFGRFWSFKISNPAGGFYAVDSIEVLPKLRHSGHV